MSTVLDIVLRAACAPWPDFTEEPLEDQEEVCAGCPVVDACLQYGIDTAADGVVYGGHQFDAGRPLLPQPGSPMAGRLQPGPKRRAANISAPTRAAIVAAASAGQMHRAIADELGLSRLLVSKIVSRARQEAS